MILLNSFSLGMLAELPASISVREISAADARLTLLLAAEADGESDYIRSAVGHADTAALFSTLLGCPVPCARATISLRPGDACVVGQYIGPRLPEGTTTLPAGAAVKWLLVDIQRGRP